MLLTFEELKICLARRIVLLKRTAERKEIIIRKRSYLSAGGQFRLLVGLII